MSSAPSTKRVIALCRMRVPTSKTLLTEFKLVTVCVLTLLLDGCVIGFTFLAACPALPNASEEDGCQEERADATSSTVDGELGGLG